MNNFLVELDLLSIKDNPQHNGKLKESKNCKLSVQKTRLLKSPQRLCSFKTNTKIYRYGFNAWAIQAWYKNIKNLYIKLNMYKRKKNNVVGKHSKFTHPILTCDTLQYVYMYFDNILRYSTFFGVKSTKKSQILYRRFFRM